MMHLSKKYGVADDENINDLIFLSEKYPNVNSHAISQAPPEIV